MNRHSGAVASNNVGLLPRVAPLRWRPQTDIIRKVLLTGRGEADHLTVSLYSEGPAASGRAALDR